MPSPARERRESPSADPEPAIVPAPEQPKKGWFRGVTAIFGAKPPARPAAESNTNALLAFPSESSPRIEPQSPPAAGAPKSVEASTPARAPKPSAPSSARLTNRTVAVIAALAVAAVVAGAAVAVLRSVPLTIFSGAAPKTGTLTIETQPIAAEVLVDGERRGLTPLTMTLAPGAHALTVRGDAEQRVVPITIAAGAEVTQRFELKVREAVALFGRVSVVTDPPGARVAIDGHARGTSPVVVSDLTAEEHTVTVTNDNGSAERKVVVTPAGTASVVFELAAKAAGPVGGWLSVSSPFDVDVVENKDVVGSSSTSRIMMAAGRHDIVLVNRTLGFQEPRKIDVSAGKTTALRLEPPQVSVSVNARPWADVLLDGASIGQTPISNLMMTVGSHELVFKNPQHPDRKQTVIVTANGPNRIAADLTK
jgi:hypothetical protein